MKAHCCWCGGPFVKIDTHYWCRTPACRVRQAQYAISIAAPSGPVIQFYVPLPKQVELELAPVRYLLGGGAAGVSKSHMARFGLYRRALEIPEFEALILRKTWNELEKHHLRLMDREAARLRSYGIPVEFSKTDREMRFGNGAIIEGGHMENPEDIEKYLSRERDAIVLDEGVTFNPFNVLELSTRARSTKPQVEAFARRFWNRPTGEIAGGGAVCWVLSNPGGQSAPMLRDFFIDHTPDFDEYPQLKDLDDEGRPLYRPEEWGYVPGNLEDNPYLPKSYERDLAVLPPWRYQQLRYNNWDVVSGQFFADFSAQIHVRDLGTPSGDVTWFRSYDYGFVHNGVAHWWAVLPDGRLYVRTEFKHQYLQIPEIARRFREINKALRIPRVAYTVADKFSMGMRKDDESGETRGETFLAWGIPVTKTSHDREQGWTRLHELFALRPDGTPGVIMHPECRLLIRELSGAVSDKTNPDDIDKNCPQDALASFRYGAMSCPSPRPYQRPKLAPHAAGHDLHALRSELTGHPFAWR